jgi:pimeloyl-ACP methyl ester carboxylesterase
LHAPRQARNERGSEVLQAIHPHEKGRALLVHGAGGDSYQWLPQLVPALWAAGFSVCAPTLPGHGREADPAQSGLDELQACVTETAEAFAPTLIVGHSMGGHLVQRHLQTHSVGRVMLLASPPPAVPHGEDLRQVMTELRCSYAREVVEKALTDAPDLNRRPLEGMPVLVIGGSRDRVVPTRWVRDTAARYGVAARFVSGGHRVMYGRAANEVMRTLAA